MEKGFKVSFEHQNCLISDIVGRGVPGVNIIYN